MLLTPTTRRPAERQASAFRSLDSYRFSRTGLTAAVSISLLLAAGCQRVLSGPKMEEDEQMRPDKVVSFDKLYGANCAGCHGTEGKNGPSIPMNNPVYMALISDDQLRQITTSGQTGTLMPAFGTKAGGLLTDEQINVIVSGMRQRWGAPIAGLNPPPYAAHTPGDSAHGSQVYAMACASCHGPVSTSGTLTGPAGKAGAIVEPTFLTLISDQSLRTIVIAGRPDFGQPDWRGDIPGRALTDQEITDLIAWMSSLRPAPAKAIATGPAQSDLSHANPSELERRVQ